MNRRQRRANKARSVDPHGDAINAAVAAAQEIMRRAGRPDVAVVMAIVGDDGTQVGWAVPFSTADRSDDLVDVLECASRACARDAEAWRAGATHAPQVVGHYTVDPRDRKPNGN